MSTRINHQSLLEMVALPTEWAVNHNPGNNTQATIVKAAPANASDQHVVRSIAFSLSAGGTAPAAAQVNVNLIQDVGGSPVTLWSMVVSITAVAGQTVPFGMPVNIEVAAGKSITLQFSAAGGNNTSESVAMTGYTKNSVAVTPAT